jgi:hypothetical protein
MRRLAFFILLIISSLVIFRNKTEAQSPKSSEIQGLLVSPGIIELQAPDQYHLHIENNTSKQIKLTIEPQLFKIDSDNEKIIPVSKETVPHRSTNFGEYIKIKTSEITLNPREKTDISIKYLKKSPDYLLGVSVKQKLNDREAQIGATGQIASIIKNKLSSEDIGNIGNLLELVYIPRIADINISNHFTIFSGVTNNSTNLIKPTGEIFVERVNEESTTRIDHINLTSQINKTIYPSNDLSLKTEYTDSRPFWERIGRISYRQVITIDGKSIIQQKDVFTIPWEILAIILMFLILIGVVFKKYIRKT